MSKALVLRVCKSDGSSHGGFVWPLDIGATVVAPDWSNSSECGNGLHGWLYGQGELCTDWHKSEGAKWLVVEVELSEVVMLGGKCKFPSCVIRFVGDSKSATDYLYENEPQSQLVSVIGACRAERQDRAVVSVSHLGTATAGDSGTATAGYSGTATAGYSGTATAGNYGTATAGDSGTATAGYSGTATAGYSGVICIKHLNGKNYVRKIAAVGENGIEPNVAYKLDQSGKFVKA